MGFPGVCHNGPMSETDGGSVVPAGGTAVAERPVEETLTATSTESAPWYVIPADRNWVRNQAVATVLVEALRRLDPQFPDVAS